MPTTEAPSEAPTPVATVKPFRTSTEMPTEPGTGLVYFRAMGYMSGMSKDSFILNAKGFVYTLLEAAPTINMIVIEDITVAQPSGDPTFSPTRASALGPSLDIEIEFLGDVDILPNTTANEVWAPVEMELTDSLMMTKRLQLQGPKYALCTLEVVILEYWNTTSSTDDSLPMLHSPTNKLAVGFGVIAGVLSVVGCMFMLWQ